MNAPRWTAPDSDRLERLRTTAELIGTVAVTATKVVAAVGTITSLLRQRSTGCR